jgi:hypothetical protein
MRGDVGIEQTDCRLLIQRAIVAPQPLRGLASLPNTLRAQRAGAGPRVTGGESRQRRLGYGEMVTNFRQVVVDFLSALKQIGEGYMHSPPGC